MVSFQKTFAVNRLTLCNLQLRRIDTYTTIRRYLKYSTCSLAVVSAYASLIQGWAHGRRKLDIAVKDGRRKFRKLREN